ncbi:MAG: peroxiredoxin, partial [Burkholderiales bacterium]
MEIGVKIAIIIGMFLAAVLYAMSAKAAEPLKAGDPAPDFSLPDQQGKARTLDEFKGSWLVLYFYPKDDTPGCTREACYFRDDHEKFAALGAAVVGISVDDTQSHASFAKKYHLPFPLLSDKGGTVAEKYGALLDLAGVYKLARRHSFLIDVQGRIAKIYR